MSALITAVVVRGGVGRSETLRDDLASMQAVVGGYVEHVTLRGRFVGLHMWVNEQGMLEGLPTWQTPFYPGPIAGDFFITRMDEAGETVSLEQADVELDMGALR